MTELTKLASSKACICFYFVERAGDCMIVTDSAGNKRYVVGYSDGDATAKTEDGITVRVTSWR